LQVEERACEKIHRIRVDNRKSCSGHHSCHQTLIRILCCVLYHLMLDFHQIDVLTVVILPVFFLIARIFILVSQVIYLDIIFVLFSENLTPLEPAHAVLLWLNYVIVIALDDYLSVFPDHEIHGLFQCTENPLGKLLIGDLREPKHAKLCTVGLYRDGQAAALVELELDEAVVDLYCGEPARDALDDEREVREVVRGMRPPGLQILLYLFVRLSNSFHICYILNYKNQFDERFKYLFHL
jgi:hypothetical protein